MENYPQAYMSMGMTAEQVAQEFNVSREGHRYGLVTMCIGGGMGAAGILMNLLQDGNGANG
jgi:acetyl-CoA acetyltransferase